MVISPSNFGLRLNLRILNQIPYEKKYPWKEAQIRAPSVDFFFNCLMSDSYLT